MRTTKTTIVAVTAAVLVAMTIQAQMQIAPTNMVLIPAGEFQMGDAFNEPRDFWAIPVHTVYVSAFYMDKYEITKMLWDEVCNWATNHGYNFDFPGLGKASNHPVHSISWLDAVKWCNARSEMEGLIPAYYTNKIQSIVYRIGQIGVLEDWVKWNAGYRLPTEAEWEKAARGGLSGKRFPWGDTISHSQANYISEATYYDESPTHGYHPDYDIGDKPYTSPVGSFAPNGYGLYDMEGNILEWCWDIFYEWYYKDSPKIDPKGFVHNYINPSSARLLRGGYWDMWTRGCYIASRNDGSSYSMGDCCGFRTILPATANIEWKQVIEIQPKQPTYSEAPKKEDAKDSLVLVTHGWQPAWKPVDTAWVDDMTNIITTYLIANRLNNWQVSAHRWVEKARPSILLLAI